MKTLIFINIRKKRIVIIEDGGGGIIKKYNEETLIKKLKEKSIIFPKINKKVFLLFGNIRKDKGHLFLSKLWKKYFSKPDDPYLWIVGHDEEKISSSILEQDSHNIVLHNSYVPLDVISCIYQKADFAILPYISTYGGGSGPLMKGAFTHSKLAIVSNVSEMGRLANEEKLAESFEAEDENSLVKCLKKVLNSGSEFYSDKINNAYNYANKRDWSNLAKGFIKSLE
ncbi:glycosyltransferase [Prochlorococcus sp. AH-716-D22]|nr:glycosyltransferase [Prochlorococcus sp. AH-716-D22]